MVVAACSGTSTPDLFEGGTGGDGSTTGDGSSTGDGSTADGGVCPNGSFPIYDKGCTTTDNCSFGLHQIDCCGTLSAVGFNHAFKDAFDLAEKPWRASCPGCGCPSGPTKAESGMTCDSNKIVVKCSTSGTGGSGKCVTSCN